MFGKQSQRSLPTVLNKFADPEIDKALRVFGDSRAIEPLQKRIADASTDGQD